MTAPETEKPAAKCAVEMHEFKPCGREPYDDKGLCICHSEKPDKDDNAFQSEIDAMLERKDYDFGGFVFPDDAWFGGRVFDGPAWFVAATFQGAANFAPATFEGEADFGGATFQGDAYFFEATFQGAAHFVGATFQGNAGFLGATFQGAADFGGATFQGKAGFWRATFQGEAHFVGATFQGEADFVWATFKGEADFCQATFQGEARFVGSGDQRVFPREAVTDFGLVRFHQPERVVFQHVFLGRARFLGADVRRVDFTDVEWARRSGGRFAIWDELAPNEKEEKKDYALIGKLYRQLKYNYEEQRDPITAGDFHFGEMHMRRLSSPPTNVVLRFLRRNLSFLAWYRWISGYGEDYILPLAWIVGAIVAFAAAFAYIPSLALQTVPSSGVSEPAAGLSSHLLYSLMCFLLRGDRPFQPAHLAGYYVSVAEGILGPPLIAMFVLALNRRFKR